MTAEGDPLGVQDRLLVAAYGCVAKSGLGKTTVEDVARASGISRATVYRYFPGGREELLRETVAWELARFFGELADHVRGTPDLAGLLAEGLVFARRAVTEHGVLQKILETEPERLLPLLSTEARRTLPFIAAFLLPYLAVEADEGRLRPGLDPGRAADYLARGILSLIGAPGRWDLDDSDQVRDLVQQELLGGISAGGDARDDV